MSLSFWFCLGDVGWACWGGGRPGQHRLQRPSQQRHRFRGPALAGCSAAPVRAPSQPHGQKHIWPRRYIYNCFEIDHVTIYNLSVHFIMTFFYSNWVYCNNNIDTYKICVIIVCDIENGSDPFAGSAEESDESGSEDDQDVLPQHKHLVRAVMDGSIRICWRHSPDHDEEGDRSRPA